MDDERLYWVTCGIYGLAMLLHGTIQLITDGATLLNWVMVLGGILVLVGGGSGLHSSDLLHRVPRPVRYLTIVGTILATTGVILSYLF